MVTVLKEVDAVVVGMGWTGSILARELTKAGLNVVGLERGGMRSPREDFAIPSIRDELKYSQRQELFQDSAMETVTLAPRAQRDRAADAAAGFVRAGHECRRRRHALERRHLALSRNRLRAEVALHREIRPQLRPRRR